MSSSSSSSNKGGETEGSSEPSTVESSFADGIRRNDVSVTEVSRFYECRSVTDSSGAVEILDALKYNSTVKKVSILQLLENQEALNKLSEVMKYNTSVECLHICLKRGLLRERIFAAASGGWSSIQELVLYDPFRFPFGFLSLTEAEHLSSFISLSENLRTLSLDVAGHETTIIMETLSRTKVQNLNIRLHSPFTLQNGGRRFTTALERCTCITELRLEFPPYNDQVEFFQQVLLLLDSIPKMLGLKKVVLQISCSVDRQFFDLVGQCIGGHQGEIEELRLIFNLSSVNSSMVGLAPALRRLKVIRFHGYAALTLHAMDELSGVVADCDSLEEFCYNLALLSRGLHTEDFKAICQLLSKFPSLKRVTQDQVRGGVDFRQENRFVAFLEMVKTSKTIEQVPKFRCSNAEEEAAITQHCHNNMMRNQIKLIRKKGLLAATVPSSAWPLILKEFSAMPDVLYYLLQQKHGAMIGPALRAIVANDSSTLVRVYI